MLENLKITKMCNISKYRNKTIPQPSESKFEDEEQSQSQNSFLDSESTSNKVKKNIEGTIDLNENHS